jgi:ATP:ADP antiporter, AAA family
MTAFLQRFLNIRREEVGPILAAALYFFCILTALMVLRPAREALGMQRGLDAVRWLFMLTLVATLFVNPVFGFLVSRFRRMTFIATMYLFFVANLGVFYGLLVLAPEAVGVTSGQVFYVWMSVFNLFVTAIFWALMADRFRFEQSKRLFGLIAVGGTTGAIFGSWLATVLAERIGTPTLLLIAMFFLTVAIAAAWTVAHLTTDQPARADVAGMSEGISGSTVPAGGSVAAGSTVTAGGTVSESRAIIGGSAWEGFRAVFRSPYLLGIAGYVLILAVMATFLYFTRLAMVAEIGDTLDARTAIFGRIDLITQIATLVLQAIVAGHLMKRLGVAVTLALLPITVALGFIGLAIVGSLAALIVFEAAFRAVQRAIMRPARETLFTVVSREDKYKAKAFIDTFVYRTGDAVGAQTEGLLIRLGMGLTALASVAVPLAIVWAGLGVWLGRVQRRIAEHQAAEPVYTDRVVAEQPAGRSGPA